MRLLIVCLLLIASTPVLSGGTDWEFMVQLVEPSDDEGYRIELRPVESSPSFPQNCDTLVVNTLYSWPFWDRHPLLSKKAYFEAIGFLKHARQARVPVRFGSMGSGLVSQSDTSECTRKSRALTIIDGEAVYSFYDPM